MAKDGLDLLNKISGFVLKDFLEISGYRVGGTVTGSIAGNNTFAAGSATVVISTRFIYGSDPATIAMWQIEPKGNRQRFSELKLDLTEYNMQQDDHVLYIFHYINLKNGIRYEVDESRDFATPIDYFAAAADQKLRCQKKSNGTRNRQHRYYKYDSLSRMTCER